MSLDPALIEETDDCIHRIKAFHKAHRRKVNRLIKPTDEGRREIYRLSEFGLPIPDDFKALYFNHDGIRPPDRMMPWHAHVLLDLRWPSILGIVDLTMIIRHQKQLHSTERIPVFMNEELVWIDLFPNMALNGSTPLVANLGLASEKTFIAFDSTIAMLRSVCAAQDAGVIRFQGKDEVLPDGTEFRKGQTRYNVKELWDVIRPHNPRADYWQAVIDGPIDWEMVDLDKIMKESIHTMPEKMPGQARDLHELNTDFETEMHKKGWTEEQITAAKELPKN